MSFLAAMLPAAMPASVAAVPSAAAIYSAYGGTSLATASSFWTLGNTALVLSTAGEVVGGLMQSGQQAAALREQAEIAQQNAAKNEAAARRDTKMRLSAISAAYGKSGVQMYGTPVEVLSETAKEGEMDALNERYAGITEARSLRRKAESTATSGALGAGTSLLKGGAKIYERWSGR